MYRYDTYCGLYCGACDIIVESRREREGNSGDPEKGTSKIECRGCKSSVLSRYCHDCAIRKCALDRGLEFCFECEKYPCNLIKEFKEDRYPHHSAAMRNLERIKEWGVQTWLKEQQERWSCGKCGYAYSWYEKACRKCGDKLYNCIAEEERGKGYGYTTGNGR